MEWIYELPNWLFFLITVTFTVAFAVGGLLLSRPWIRTHAGEPPAQNELVSDFLGAVGVIYGIALGLVAAGTWSNFTDLSAQVDEEAAIVSALYQDVSTYPTATRQLLQQDLRQYVKAVIEQDWPQQSQGIVPRASTRVIRSFRQHLFDFSPTSGRLKIIQEQSINQYNELAKIRRLRLRGNQSSLPPVLWWIIITGAVVNIVVTWFFVSSHTSYHMWLTGLFAFLLGSLLFLTAAIDNPFRGDFSVDAGAFTMLRGQTTGDAGD